jgi:Domain of unknown function (DUF4915)
MPACVRRLVEPATGEQPGVAGEPTPRPLDDERRAEEVQDLGPWGWYTPRLPPRLRKGAEVLSGPYAFVGLSKIRKTSATNGVPLAQRRERLKCGVAVIDLRSGRVLASLEFQTAAEESFDVQLLPGLRFPEVVGFQQQDILHTFIDPRQYAENGARP